ncbi:MAG: aminotransferase class I/II-fold pyridoxal phosphate-dependent enzyme [Terriglobales bacterium]
MERTPHSGAEVSASIQFQEGLALFNQAQFYEAHEVLEDAWRASQEPAKRFLQALIQIAVGLHHHSTGNTTGARSLLARGGAKLERYPDAYCGLDVQALRAAVEGWRHSLEPAAAGLPTPPFPRLEAIPGAKITPPVTEPGSSKPSASAGSAVVSATQVPLLDLRRQYAPIRQEILSALERVCSSQHFILGEEVLSLEREIAAYTGAACAVGCASGTDALWLALAAAGIQPGDEVITTPFSFFASASAILRCWARPVFLDIDPQTFNLDPAQVERRITSRKSSTLRAVLPVHLYGQCADMDAFRRLSAEHKLSIIEDAAQAFGAAWRGQRAGSLGLAAAFSFYPTKNLSCYGDGGCVTTSDPALADRIRLLRNHGSRQRYHHEEVGWNSRLDALQAAVLRVKMKYIDEWNARRREVAANYDRLFAQAGLAGKSSADPLQLPFIAPQGHHIFHQYVVRARRRDDLRRHLTERGVGTEIYYPAPLHLQKSYTFLGYAEGNFPESERASREVLALPIFPELTAEEQSAVVETIAEFYS